MKKRTMSVLLMLILVFSSLAPTMAGAMTWNNKETLTIKKNEKEEIRIPGDYGTAQWAKSDPAGIVLVESVGIKGVEIEAVNAGKTVLTISSMSKNDNGIWETHTGTIPIEVVDESGTSGNVVPNYRLEVGTSIIGAAHKEITTNPIVDPSGIVTAAKNPVQAAVDGTNAANLGIKSTTGYALTFTGLAPGLVTVRYNYKDSETGSEIHYANVIIEVVEIGALAESGTAAVSLVQGSVSTLSKDYYAISNIKISTESVISAEETGTKGTMNLKVTAKAPGNSVVSFSYKDKEADAFSYAEISIAVRGVQSGVSSDSDVNSGLYLTPRLSRVPVNKNKNWTANVRVNGEKLEEGDNKWTDLVWISTIPSVAKVNPITGEFVVLKKGTTKIICMTGDGKLMDTIVIIGE